MLYPKDNSFTLSTNMHSLGLQNNMTITPTIGSVAFRNNLANWKNHLTQGALRKKMIRVVNTSGQTDNIWGR